VDRAEPSLHASYCEPAGFEWVDASDVAAGVISFLRLGAGSEARSGSGSRSGDRRPVLVVVNATPVRREGYHIGVSVGGRWEEVANSDRAEYGGSHAGNFGGVTAVPEPMHGRPLSLPLVLPPLGVLFLVPGS
jgi:1,4-alpha-glucan branching enzyme